MCKLHAECVYSALIPAADDVTEIQQRSSVVCV